MSGPRPVSHSNRGMRPDKTEWLCHIGKVPIVPSNHLEPKEPIMPEIAEPNQTDKTSRRGFLARTAALAGAGAAASLALQRSVHAAGSDVIKIGLIGCGGRGSGAVLSALSVNPAARLTAMSDAFRDRMVRARDNIIKRLVRDKVGVQTPGDQLTVDDDHLFDGFHGYERLLESGVDVVLLAEPPHFRPMHAEASVDAGVHVFAEKPMAVDAPGVRKILSSGQKAKEKNLSFVSGFETRYSAAAREAVRRVHDGAIGEITSIEVNFNTGPLWHRGREPDWTEMQFQMRNWYYFTWLSGDHLVEQHVHLEDFVAWIMHDEAPMHAWGIGGRQSRVEGKWGDIYDHHGVVYEYPSGTRVYAFCRQQANTYNEVSKRVFGTKGRLVPGRAGWSSYVIDGENSWTAPKEAGHPELTTFREMFAGIESGKPINDSLSMSRSTMLAILGRMATHGGQRVTWDDAINSDLDLSPKSYAWDADPPVMPGPDGQYPVAIPGMTKAL